MNLTRYGWNDRLKSLFAAAGGDAHVPARVIRVDRGRLVLAAADGELSAVASRRLEDGPLTVGDWVAVDRSADTAVVRAILPRTTCLARRAAGGERQAQLLAANVDLVLVVEGLDRGANPRRIERAAAIAWDAAATPKGAWHRTAEIFGIGRQNTPPGAGHSSTVFNWLRTTPQRR